MVSTVCLWVLGALRTLVGGSKSGFGFGVSGSVVLGLRVSGLGLEVRAYASGILNPKP